MSTPPATGGGAFEAPSIRQALHTKGPVDDDPVALLHPGPWPVQLSDDKC